MKTIIIILLLSTTACIPFRDVAHYEAKLKIFTPFTFEGDDLPEYRHYRLKESALLVSRHARKPRKVEREIRKRIIGYEQPGWFKVDLWINGKAKACYIYHVKECGSIELKQYF